MKKAKKLVLSRETLRPLESGAVGAIQQVLFSASPNPCPQTGDSCCCTMGCNLTTSDLC